jgi:hypothetical protein
MTFKLKIISINNFNIIRVPFEIGSFLPSRGLVMVNVIINDFQFTTALEPDGLKGHWMMLDQSTLQSIKSKVGDLVDVQINTTKDWIEPVIPSDLKIALNQTPHIHDLWDEVTIMAKWEWIRWINSTRNPITRNKRIEVGISKLIKGSKRPCCFNGSQCTVMEVSKNGILLDDE